MKLVNRERIDGTQITLGKRVYYKDGKKVTAKSFSAEYTDHEGKQQCRTLGTKNIAHARRRAIKIQEQLETGVESRSPSRISIKELTGQYISMIKTKGTAPKTQAKYRTDLEKLKDFCDENNIRLARKFSQNDLYLYRQYLIEQRGYAAKTVQGAIVLAKQLFKWAWRYKILPHYDLETVTFPKAKANPQPCFTSEQVDSLIEAGDSEEKIAFALMGYAGLRIGEVEQLQREDIVTKKKQFTMLHIQRGGSNGTTKDKDDRFVPVHPKIAELLKLYKKNKGTLLPAINERKLLKRLKSLCTVCEFEDPAQYKLHSFRHHFASMCANHGAAYKKVLAWLGHSSSEMLDLYYHLHDEDSHNTMMELAKSHDVEIVPAPNKGNLRATGQSKIAKNTQVPELKEVIECILAENKTTERAGFEPAVRINPHTAFPRLHHQPLGHLSNVVLSC